MLDLTIDSMANGGEGVARGPDGRVVFVSGALPGERVRAAVVADKQRYARAETVEVIEPSPARVPPRCRTHDAGCGGCDLRHLGAGEQPSVKTAVVLEVLERLGGFTGVPVHTGEAAPPDGGRTTVRCGVVEGRAGYRRRRGHQVVVAHECPVAHPLVAELVTEGRFGAAQEVTLRAGAHTGERLVVAHPSAAGVRVPADVRVVGTDELGAGRRAWFHEEIAGRRLRVSAQSFFQSGPAAAELLVDAVTRAVARGEVAAGVPEGAGAADLYAGVGLLAATVFADRGVVAVERSASSVADARVNLEGSAARVVPGAVERWRPSGDLGVVVADPPRSGLGRGGAATVARTGAPVVALVSCDPGSLARDASLLRASGYALSGAEVVDCFPQTSHIEVVSLFLADP